MFSATGKNERNTPKMAASISAGLRTCNFCKCFHLFKRQMKNDICFLKFKRTYKSFSITVDQDKQLVLEIGHMAKFADGSVVAKYGDTSVLVAITSRTEGANTASFLPLTVDYRQKSAAAGRIPTNHLRKELGPTDKEILTGRVIDRSLRALFPADYFYETQITCNLLSVDGVNDPDVVSINAASAALTLSNIPWNGPVGSVRVSCDPKGEFIINPTRKQQNTSSMNVVITTDQQENVVMLEGDAENVPYETFGKGVIYGAKYAANIAKMIAEIEPNKPAKRSYKPAMQVPDKMIEMVESIGAATINDIMYDTSHDKISRDKAINMARNSIVGTFFKDHPDEDKLMMHEAVSLVIRKLFRSQILVDSKRCDGRQLTEVRPISCSVDLFKPLHGSALFQRGQTQVLSTVTFDSLQASLKVDPMSVVTGEMKEKNFLLHYEFPSYATNEIKVPGTKTRRELGHGALAEKGLRPVLPDKFPFSIRLSCEVLESNGSSSMASICSGSLALMDAGVQISQPAAGVAIGLVASPTTQNEKKYILLSDIMGIEDYMGDMDFKIGGTWSGVTAVQMDLKIPGIPVKVLLDALDRAKTNIQHILVQMLKGSIAQPRPTFKPNGPVIGGYAIAISEQINVPPAKRANFIGIGGLNVRKLQSETGVQLTTIDESNFQVFAPNQDAMNEAKEMMNTWLEAKKEPELEFNAVYDAKIVELKDIGVMVQIHPAMNPVLLHNKQLDHRKFFGKANVKFSFHTWGTLSVECIDSFPCVECKLPVDHPSVLGFEVGQTISVKYFGRDPVTGKIRISRKVISGLSTDRFKFMQEET